MLNWVIDLYFCSLEDKRSNDGVKESNTAFDRGSERTNNSTTSSGKSSPPQKLKNNEKANAEPAVAVNMADLEDFYTESELQKLLEELASANQLNNAQNSLPSHLPGFNSIDQNRNWRNFLRGKPGLDGQAFRRYGSRLSPDANGEVCYAGFAFFHSFV